MSPIPSFFPRPTPLPTAALNLFFVDVERATLGLDPQKLADFLEKETVAHPDGHRYNGISGKRFAACVPLAIRCGLTIS
jgi:hypothetical protein